MIIINVAGRIGAVESVLKLIAASAPIILIYLIFIAPAGRPTFEFLSVAFEPVIELNYQNHLKASVLPDKVTNLPVRRAEWCKQPHLSLIIDQVLVLQLVIPEDDQFAENQARQPDMGKILAAVYVLPDIPGDVHERTLAEHFPTVQAQLQAWA